MQPVADPSAPRSSFPGAAAQTESRTAASNSRITQKRLSAASRRRRGNLTDPLDRIMGTSRLPTLYMTFPL